MVCDGPSLKRYRKAHGVSQDAVARRVGLSRSAIAWLEGLAEVPAGRGEEVMAAVEAERRESLEEVGCVGR